MRGFSISFTEWEICKKSNTCLTSPPLYSLLYPPTPPGPAVSLPPVCPNRYPLSSSVPAERQVRKTYTTSPLVTSMVLLIIVFALLRLPKAVIFRCKLNILDFLLGRCTGSFQSDIRNIQANNDIISQRQPFSAKAGPILLTRGVKEF